MRGIMSEFLWAFIGVHVLSAPPSCPYKVGGPHRNSYNMGWRFVPSSVLLGVLTASLRCPPWCWMMCPPSRGLVSPCLPLSPHMCACVGWRRSCLPVSPCPPEGRTMKPAGKQQASKQASQPGRQAGRPSKQASQLESKQASQARKQASN